LSTSTPVQSPRGRQQLDTPFATPISTAAAAITASVPVTQSGDKPGGRVQE